MTRPKLVFTSLLAVTLIAVSGFATAQELVAPAVPAAPAAPELPPLPESNDDAAVIEYLQGLNQIGPEENTREALTALILAIGSKVDELTARPLEGEAAINALSFRFSTFDVESQLGVPNTFEKRDAWLAKLASSDRPIYSQTAKGLAILRTLSSEEIALGKEDAWQAVMESALTFYREASDTPFAGMVAMQVAESAEMAAPPQQGATINREVAKLLAKSENASLRMVAEQLDGVARRLELPGSEMIVTGEQLDGSQFELTSLKGKVVIVDFWATWCPLCIEAFPEMEALYTKYKNAGLEIVGVNIDDTRELWTEYLEKRPLPWIHVQNLGTSELDRHPNANRYGITGIPFLAVVGRDGKVVQARVAPQELKTLIPTLLRGDSSSSGE